MPLELFAKTFISNFSTSLYSIGPKFLDRYEKTGVKYYDLFLLLEWLKRSFSHVSIIPSLDFSEILTTFRNYFAFQLILRCDVIKFLNHRPRVLLDAMDLLKII